VNNFLGALEDIKHYAGWEFSAMIAKLETMCISVLDWLRLPSNSEEYEDLPSQLMHLEDAIRLDGPFCQMFDYVFHSNVDELRSYLTKRAEETGCGRLRFEYSVTPDVKGSSVLTNVNGLRICLANRTIDPIEHRPGEHVSRIAVRFTDSESGNRRLVFRMLTNFASLSETINATQAGSSGHAEQAMLETYGVSFGSWMDPTEEEKSYDFTAALEIIVLTGLVPRST
jgi:hypothetical protein